MKKSLSLIIILAVVTLFAVCEKVYAADEPHNENERMISLDRAKGLLELIGYGNAQYIGDTSPDNIPACDSFDVYYFVLFLNETENDYYIAISKEYDGMYWEFQSENGGFWHMGAGGFSPNGYLLYNLKISQDHKLISGGKEYILFNNWTHGISSL